MRTYKVVLKKSGCETPRAELDEIGPSMNLTFRRAKLASQQQFGKACKRPAELKAKNVKNIVKDPLTGEVGGKIHMGQQVKQDLEQLNLGHKKVFKRAMPEKESLIISITFFAIAHITVVSIRPYTAKFRYDYRALDYNTSQVDAYN